MTKREEIVTTRPQPPSFDKTYRRADGEPVRGEYGWVTDIDGYEDDEDGPVEWVEETWERTAVRRFWQLPEALYDCDVDHCDEDAVAWVQRADASWTQRCDEHRAAAAEEKP